MKIGMIAPSHDDAGIAAVASLGLKWIEFDINADDISYFDADAIKESLSAHGMHAGAIGRWGRPRIEKS